MVFRIRFGVSGVSFEAYLRDFLATSFGSICSRDSLPTGSLP
jgi:hypothetical protein